jgi:hypothetical protein
LKRASTLEWLREGLGIIAANISKAGWSWGANQPLIQRGEQSGLRTHREDNQRFVVHADEKLTAFLELERVIRAAANCVDNLTRLFKTGRR